MAYAKINSVTNANMAKVNSAAKAALGKIGSIDAPSTGLTNTKSIDFDGVDDMLISSNVSIAGAGTLSWWMKTDSVGTSGSYFIIRFGEYSSNYARISSGDLKFYWMTMGGALTIASEHRDDYLDDGEWHHFVFTISRPGGNNTEAVHKAYLDATEIGTKTWTRDQAPYTPSVLVIGAADSSGTSPITCQIDECSWWDQVALDADAITALYNSGEPIDLSEDSGDYDNSGDLTHWWRMGDGDTYPTIEDNAGSNDLTMTNMVSGDIEDDAPSA